MRRTAEPAAQVATRQANTADDSRGPQYEALVSQPQTDAKLPTPSPDAPAFLYFTSGSTGKPKGVTHTQQTFGWMTVAAIQGMELTGADTFLPSFLQRRVRTEGIAGSLFGPAALASGGRLVIPRGSDGPEVLPLLQQFRPTVVWMLPAALITLVRDHDAVATDFSSIRLCVSGGDKVSAELEREFTEMAGFPIDEGYGMTEFGLSTINPPSGENRIGSVGQLAPGYEMSLRDDAGGEVPVGTEGRLWIRSVANMIGYWNNQQATDETIVDGWLDTGDVMRVGYKAPDEIVILDEMPLNATGKVDRVTLKRMAEQRLATAATSG